MDTKKCSTCKKFLPLSYFYKDGKTANCCRECSLAYMRTKKQYLKEYYQKNKTKILGKMRLRYSKEKGKASDRHKKLRRKFFDMYGASCSCCKENTEDFLTLEHKNGQRGIPKHKKESSSIAYRNATKQYRPDLYEVLCYNCNCSKGKLGYCPHTINHQTP